jgi:hypothetical protein
MSYLEKKMKKVSRDGTGFAKESVILSDQRRRILNYFPLCELSLCTLHHFTRNVYTK